MGKYGYIKIDIPNRSEAGQAILDARALVSDAHLAGRGKDVGETHITLCYGLMDDAILQLEAFLSTQVPFQVTLGTTASFPPSDSSDGAAVLIAPVSSPTLHELNEEVTHHAAFAPADFDYAPHATIAYVQPEELSQYVGNELTNGQRCTVHEVSICKPDGSHVEVKLGGVGHRYSEDQPRDPDGKFASGGGIDGAGKNGDWGASPNSPDGDCFLFATAASQVTGWPMAELSNSDGESFHTVVVKPDGKLFDGSGTTTVDKVAEKWGVTDISLDALPKEAGENYDHSELKIAIEAVKEKLGRRSLRFSEDQPRDGAGKWTSSGTSVAGDVKTTTYSKAEHTIVVSHNTKENKITVKHLDANGDLLVQQTHDSVGAARKELTTQGIDHKFYALRSLFLRYSDDQPRDDHGRWAGTGASKSDKKTVGRGMWGASHGTSFAMAGYSAQLMGIEGYRYKPEMLDAKERNDTVKMLSAIHHDVEAGGSEEPLYHGFQNIKNIEWKEGDTLDLPLTATSGDLHNSANYGIRLDPKDQEGAPTVFEFPRGTPIAPYAKWKVADAKEFGHIYQEAITAGRFKVAGTRTEKEETWRARDITVVRLDPTHTYDPVAKEWKKI